MVRNVQFVKRVCPANHQNKKAAVRLLLLIQAKKRRCVINSGDFLTARRPCQVQSLMPGEFRTDCLMGTERWQRPVSRAPVFGASEVMDVHDTVPNLTFALCSRGISACNLDSFFFWWLYVLSFCWTSHRAGILSGGRSLDLECLGHTCLMSETCFDFSAVN